jgi:hypothetical protein
MEHVFDQLVSDLTELQGVPRDPAHQRHKVHHVAQRLLPLRDKPQAMVGTFFTSG